MLFRSQLDNYLAYIKLKSEDWNIGLDMIGTKDVDGVVRKAIVVVSYADLLELLNIYDEVWILQTGAYLWDKRVMNGRGVVVRKG